MALAPRFAEEGEFSSRACDVSLLETPDVPSSSAIFRWSRKARECMGSEPVHVKTLVVAVSAPAQQFVQQLAASWTPVGTLVTNDQTIPSCNLQNELKSAVILSKNGVKVSDSDNTLAVLVGSEVPVAATWVWLNKLTEHVDADEIVCLDSQLSAIYADQYADKESGPQLRVLASSSVTEESMLQTPVRPLEVPQFVGGVPAALLTHGELRKRRVRVFVSLRDVSSTPVDVVRSFVSLVASSSSVLGALDRPLFFQPRAEPQDGSASSLNVLYT